MNIIQGNNDLLYDLACLNIRKKMMYLRLTYNSMFRLTSFVHVNSNETVGIQTHLTELNVKQPTKGKLYNFNGTIVPAPLAFFPI